MKAQRLRTARRGRSFYDENAQRLIRVEDDVLGIISEITLRWPELHVFWDELKEEWVVVEVQRDGTESLATTSKVLDQRLIEHLASIRDLSGDELLKKIDDHNAQLERQNESRMDDIAGDVAERLVHAFKKDGLHNHVNIYGSKKRLKTTPVPRLHR